VSSELVEVEARRAARREGRAAERLIDAALAGISLVPIDDEVRRVATRVEPLSLRSLDAIHLATALLVGEIAAMIAYDRRLLDAARNRGLEVLSPA
jgi:predicted nucleic acid-binding protein